MYVFVCLLFVFVFVYNSGYILIFKCDAGPGTAKGSPLLAGASWGATASYGIR